MSTAEEIAEFVSLWFLVQNVQLTDSEDEIRWKWTADGNYTAKSAYNIQFSGAYCTFDAKAIWRAVLLTQRRSGEQKQKGSTVFLLGFWCKTSC